NSGSGMPKPIGVVVRRGLLKKSLVREVSYHFVIPRIDSVVQVVHGVWSVVWASGHRCRAVACSLVAEETMNDPCQSPCRCGVWQGTRPDPLAPRPEGTGWR